MKRYLLSLLALLLAGVQPAAAQTSASTDKQRTKDQRILQALRDLEESDSLESLGNGDVVIKESTLDRLRKNGFIKDEMSKAQVICPTLE